MTGLPRSGSTFMHQLLAEDPNCRGLCNWEMASCPVPPTREDEYFTDPRITAMQEQQKAMSKIAPRFDEVVSVMHAVEPLKVDEHHLVQDDAIMDLFGAVLSFTVPGQAYYKRYTEGIKPGFVYLKRYLQMKSSAYSPSSHWILKNPVDSLTGIENILDEFPDARIVLTHRDMMAVARSNYPLMKAVFGLYGYITTEHVVEFFLTWMDKATDEMIQLVSRAAGKNP